MKRRSRIQSYLQKTLLDFGYQLRKNKGRITPTEVKRVLYIFKIVDILWFDCNIPSNYEEKFQVIFNTEWEWKDQVSDIMEIVDLNEEALRYISEKLRTPYWVSVGESLLVSIDNVLNSSGRP